MIHGIRGMAVSGVARVASTVKRGVTISSRNTPMENPALTSTWSVAHRNICWKSRVVHWSVTVSDISLMMVLPTLATKIGLNGPCSYSNSITGLTAARVLRSSKTTLHETSFRIHESFCRKTLPPLSCFAP